MPKIQCYWTSTLDTSLFEDITVISSQTSRVTCSGCSLRDEWRMKRVVKL